MKKLKVEHQARIQGNDRRPRRKRGVVLTPLGFNRLNEAKTQIEFQENAGNHYTLEAMCTRTGLSVDTLMKVFAREVGVRQTNAQACFSAFNLTLVASDYTWPGSEAETDVPPATVLATGVEPEFPDGQVSLNSTFYIERPPIETDCYEGILRPGALIRIKAPRRMGKTSLMSRILHQANFQGYDTISLSLQLAEKTVLQDLEKFLQWFCASVTLGLGLPNRLGDYWMNCLAVK